MKIRNLLYGAVATTAIVALAGCSTGGSDGSGEGSGGEDLTGTVTLLLPNTTTTRFIEHDGPAFEAAMAELAPDIKVEVFNAEGDSETQIRQAETAILNGTKGIVLTSADPALSASILQKADESAIPVISYEHEALDGPLTYQVINDPLKVGEAQGSYFADHLPEAADGPIQLARVYGNAGDNYTIKVKEGQDEYIDKLVADGKVEVVCEDNAAGWDPANAQNIVEQCLTKTSNKVDAVLNSNDGTASGAIAALEAQQLGGTIPVYGGQDANLDALKYILQGLQTDTVFKNYAEEGKVAAELMVATLKGEDPEEGVVNAEFDNGFAKIPAAYLDVESVDIDNMQTVVDAGLYTKEEICDGVETDAEFCKS